MNHRSGHRWPRPRDPLPDLVLAWAIATAFSGAPSTLHALATGADPLEATFAAGAMLLPAETDPATLFAAAALVHATVSAFWSVVFGYALRGERVVAPAIVGSALVALVDLRVIAPAAFPPVAALAFWPQFADHLMWGACLGVTLAWRRRVAARRQRRATAGAG